MIVPTIKEFKDYLSINSKIRNNLSRAKDRFRNSVSQEILETAEYNKNYYTRIKNLICIVIINMKLKKKAYILYKCIE